MKRSALKRSTQPLKRTSFKKPSYAEVLESRQTKKKKSGGWGRIKRDPADIWFSKYIRLKAGFICAVCKRFCGENGGEASHFHGRRKESVRFDEDNVVCSCFGCHRRFTEMPQEHRAWKLKQLGQQRFDALNVRANLPAQKDRKLMAIVWRAEYDKLKETASNERVP